MPARSKRRSSPSGRPRELDRAPRPGGHGARFDAHLHLSRYWPDLARTGYSRGIDFSVKGLLRELDAEGIGAGLVLQLPEAPTVAATLEEGEQLRRESRGRLLRTSTVDPTRGREAVAAAIAAWSAETDLAALKLYPGYRSFYPHDRRLEPVYDFAARRGLPVLFHQGDTLDRGGLVKFARPIEVDEVAVRFRDVRFVLCHLGNPWIEEAAEIVYKNENVYADTSGLLGHPTLPLFDGMVRRIVHRLGHALESIGGVDRILYGSDWPLESIRTAVGIIEQLPLGPEDRERILGGNARRLFHRFLPEVPRAREKPTPQVRTAGS